MTQNQWFVARTNPRCEDRAVKSIGEAGYATYAPRLRKLRIHHRTKAEIEREYPLMVGYVFVSLPSAAHVSHIRKCDGLKSVLGVQGEPLPIPSSDVDDLFDAEFRGQFDDVWINRKKAMDAIKPTFERNELVEIVDGVFATEHGVIAKMFGKNRALVRVEKALGQMIEVSVPIDRIRKAA